MLEELNKCKTIKELYRELGEKWITPAITFLCILLAFSPILASGSYIKYRYLENDKWLRDHYIFSGYQSIISSLGLLLLLLFSILMLRFVVINCDAKRKAFLSYAKKNPWNVVLFLMLLWAGICTICSDSLVACIRGDDYRFEGLYMYVLYMAIYGCGVFLQSNERKRIVFYFFSGVGNLLSLLMLAQVCGWLGAEQTFYNIRSAVFFNANHLGYFLNLSILSLAGLFYFEKNHFLQLYLVIAMAFQIFTLIINNTFGCYLAMCVAIPIAIVFVVRKERVFHFKYLIPVGIIFWLSIASSLRMFDSIAVQTVAENIIRLFKDVSRVAQDVTQAPDAGTNRIELWLESFRLIPNHPIVGYGPDAYLSDFMMEKGGRPHNEYLQHALYLGIPGLLFYLLALGGMGVNRWKNLRNLSEMQIVAGGCVVTYLISACFGNTMFYTTPYFWLFLGFLF